MLCDKVLRMHFIDSILHFILRFSCCNSSSNGGLNHHLKQLPVEKKKKKEKQYILMQKELNKYDGGARKLVRHVIFPSKDRWSDKPQRLTCGAFNSIP